MASKATPRRRKEGALAGTVKRMCSIHPTGVIFENTVPLEISSELTITIQTSLLGSARDWTVQGWVVGCSTLDQGYQVTLLFSTLPKGLHEVLALADGERVRPYPLLHGAEIYGLN